MQGLTTKEMDVEQNKELFEYEMTEVLLKLKGEFAVVSGQDTRYAESSVDESKLAVNLSDIPKVEAGQVKIDVEVSGTETLEIDPKMTDAPVSVEKINLAVSDTAGLNVGIIDPKNIVQIPVLIDNEVIKSVDRQVTMPSVNTTTEFVVNSAFDFGDLKKGTGLVEMIEKGLAASEKSLDEEKKLKALENELADIANKAYVNINYQEAITKETDFKSEYNIPGIVEKSLELTDDNGLNGVSLQLSSDVRDSLAARPSVSVNSTNDIKVENISVDMPDACDFSYAGDIDLNDIKDIAVDFDINDVKMPIEMEAVSVSLGQVPVVDAKAPTIPDLADVNVSSTAAELPELPEIPDFSSYVNELIDSLTNR